MKVILLEDIKKIGKESEVVEVKSGYARNYLIPNGLAVLAGKNAQKQITELKKRTAKLLERKKQDFLEIKKKIEALSLNIEVEAKDDETLYGSVTETQIVQAAGENGVALANAKLTFEEPIKKIGVYKIPVNLGCDVSATLRVWVVKK